MLSEVCSVSSRDAEAGECGSIVFITEEADGGEQGIKRYHNIFGYMETIIIPQ
jgi:hypothetical protein